MPKATSVVPDIRYHGRQLFYSREHGGESVGDIFSNLVGNTFGRIKADLCCLLFSPRLSFMCSAKKIDASAVFLVFLITIKCYHGMFHTLYNYNSW